MAGVHGSFSSLPGVMTSYLAPRREEFQEADVWGAGLVSKGSAKHLRKSKSAPNNHVPKSPSASSGGGGGRISQPVDVPDWNRILKEEAPKKKWWDEDDEACYHGEEDGDFSGRKSHRPHLEDEDEDEGVLPPHEFLARRWKRSGPAAYSMCEGVGRTLKGRDLVNVRNFVLSKTGFIE